MAGFFIPFEQYNQDLTRSLSGLCHVYPSKAVSCMMTIGNNPQNVVKNTLSQIWTDVQNSMTDVTGPTLTQKQYGWVRYCFQQHIIEILHQNSNGAADKKGVSAVDINFLSHELHDGCLYNETYVSITREAIEQTIQLSYDANARAYSSFNTDDALTDIFTNAVAERTSDTAQFNVIILYYNLYAVDTESKTADTQPIAKCMPMGIYVPTNKDGITIAKPNVTNTGLQADWSTRISYRLVNSGTISAPGTDRSGEFATLSRVLQEFGDIAQVMDNILHKRPITVTSNTEVPNTASISLAPEDIKSYLEEFRQEHAVNVPYIKDGHWFVNGRDLGLIGENIDWVNLFGLWLLNSATDEQLALLKGAKGDPGEQGPQGPEGGAGGPGPVGPAGPVGPVPLLSVQNGDLYVDNRDGRGPQLLFSGIKGLPGANGSTPKITGNGTEIFVDNKDGLGTHSIGNFKGPKGDKGDTPTFEIDSAGHLWMKIGDEPKRDLGNVRGADGKDGADGADGKNGENGAAGQGVNASDFSVENGYLKFRGTSVGYVKGDTGDKGSTPTFTVVDGVLKSSIDGGPWVPIGDVKGPKGDPLTFNDLTTAQKNQLKGPKGDPASTKPSLYYSDYAKIIRVYYGAQNYGSVEEYTVEEDDDALLWSYLLTYGDQTTAAASTFTVYGKVMGSSDEDDEISLDLNTTPSTTVANDDIDPTTICIKATLKSSTPDGNGGFSIDTYNDTQIFHARTGTTPKGVPYAIIIVPVDPKPIGAIHKYSSHYNFIWSRKETKNTVAALNINTTYILRAVNGIYAGPKINASVSYAGITVNTTASIKFGELRRGGTGTTNVFNTYRDGAILAPRTADGSKNVYLEFRRGDRTITPESWPALNVSGNNVAINQNGASTASISFGVPTRKSFGSRGCSDGKYWMTIEDTDNTGCRSATRSTEYFVNKMFNAINTSCPGGFDWMRFRRDYLPDGVVKTETNNHVTKVAHDGTQPPFRINFANGYFQSVYMTDIIVDPRYNTIMNLQVFGYLVAQGPEGPFFTPLCIWWCDNCTRRLRLSTDDKDHPFPRGTSFLFDINNTDNTVTVDVIKSILNELDNKDKKGTTLVLNTLVSNAIESKIAAKKRNVFSFNDVTESSGLGFAASIWGYGMAMPFNIYYTTSGNSNEGSQYGMPLSKFVLPTADVIKRFIYYPETTITENNAQVKVTNSIFSTHWWMPAAKYDNLGVYISGLNVSSNLYATSTEDGEFTTHDVWANMSPGSSSITLPSKNTGQSDLINFAFLAQHVY